MLAMLPASTKVFWWGRDPSSPCLECLGLFNAFGETLVPMRCLSSFSWVLFFWRCGSQHSYFFPCWNQ